MRDGCRLLLIATLAPAALLAVGDAPLARAVDLITARNFQAACETLRPLSRDLPRDPDVWNLLGICESELDRSSAAQNAFQKGLAVSPKSVPLHENLGLLYFNRGEYADARRCLAEAVALGSTQPGVAFSLAASEIRTGDPTRGLARLVAIEAVLAGQSAYWAERGWVELADNAPAAAASFERALSLAPADLRALNGAASAAEAQHEDEKALSYLLRARKAQPDDLRTLLHFGALCLRKDLSVDARDALERARKLAPSNNLALFLYARVQIAFQQWQQAHDLFTEFYRKVPNNPQAQYALGWLDLKLNRSAEARSHLEKSLALDPRLSDARYELAQLDLDEGRLDAAETQLKTVLTAQPSHAKANIAMGDLQLKRGDLPAARSSYEAAIAADTQSGPAHYKLSTVLMRLHETARAAEERALGARLNAQAETAAKTVLVLAEPDGRLLTSEATWR